MPQNASQQGNPTYGGTPVIASPIAGSSTQLSSPGAPGIPSVDTESQKATYSYTTASMTLVATPTDIVQISCPVGKVIRLKRLRTQVKSTVSGVLNLALVRRSTGSTGGTSASGTVNKFDLSDPTTSASIVSFTANPSTTGTTVSTLVNLVQPVNAAASPQQAVDVHFGDVNTKAIVLRAGEFLVLNGGLSTLTNADNALTCEMEWTEEFTGV